MSIPKASKYNLQKNLKARAEHIGIKGARELAKMSGVSKSMVAYVFSTMEDKCNISLDRLDGLASAVGIPPWYLLVDPEKFCVDLPADAMEILDALSKLDHDSKQKVFAYMTDLIHAQIGHLKQNPLADEL
jgi:transcriptional regulator with XRE-family HTH domain